mgnify:CR=1 FL=1
MTQADPRQQSQSATTGVSRARQAIGVVVLILVLAGGWALFARAGMFATLRYSLGFNLPGQSYSFTFIPAGKFCSSGARRCFFIDIGGRTMSPVAEKGMAGVTFTIVDSPSKAADLKASFNMFVFEMVVKDADTITMRSSDIDDGEWRTYQRTP